MYILIFFILLLFILYKYLCRNHDHWRKLGVPYFPPTPIFGNVWKLVTLMESPGVVLGEIYNHPQAKGQRYMGMFLWNSEPALLIRDPEIIKHILVKDFPHFHNRYRTCDANRDPIGHNNLAMLPGEKWKALRTKLSPSFSSVRLKLMFSLIVGVADELLKNIDQELADSGENSVIIGTRELMARYTTDIITTTAFGIKSNSLNDPKAIFREFGKRVFMFSVRRSIELRSCFFMHGLSKVLGAYFFSRETSEFFRAVFWDAIKVREEQNIKRNDFLDILIQLKNESLKKKESGCNDDILQFEADFLVSQAAVFFVAGFDTTSSAICHCLLELAYAPHIQDKLREEINKTLDGDNGEITYDHLFEMKYLHQVVSETLRKYPAASFLDRRCTIDYKIPDSDLTIKKGTPIFISLFDGLHYDEEYYPDPQKFDPERFSASGIDSRHTSSYIPFGDGPHICIGMRFALMNVKTSLVKVLSKYRVDLAAEAKVPARIEPRSFHVSVEGPMSLRFTPV